MPRLVHWPQDEDEKNMDQSQDTLVIPTKATLDQPIGNELPDMEGVPAKKSQVQPRSDEPHRLLSWTNTYCCMPLTFVVGRHTTF